MERVVHAKRSQVSAYRLMKRDLEILSAIEDACELNEQEIEARFWRGQGNRNHEKRLQKLVLQRFLLQLPSSRYPIRTYVLTNKGHQVLAVRDRHLFTGKPGRPRFPSAAHDLTVRNVRTAMQVLPFVVSVQPEHHLIKTSIDIRPKKRQAKGTAKLPDALIELAYPGNPIRRVALEVELTLKSRPRYIEIFEEYASTDEYDGCLYLLADAKSLRRFKNLVDKLPPKSPMAGSFLRFSTVGLALVSDFQKDPANAPIYVGNCFVTLHEFAPIGGRP